MLRVLGVLVSTVVMAYALVGCNSAPSSEGGEVSSNPSPSANASNFQSHVVDFMAVNCLSCHTGGNAAGNIDLSLIKTEEDAKKYLEILQKASDEVTAQKMPPKKQLAEEVKTNFANAIAAIK